MTELVIDASIAVKWLIEEEHTEIASLLLGRIQDGGLLAHVPDLVYAEVANTLHKKMRVRDLKAEEIRDAAVLFSRIEWIVHPSQSLFARAVELSMQTGWSAYDTHYLALAEALKVRLVTADARFHRGLAASKWKRHALWIGDVS